MRLVVVTLSDYSALQMVKPLLQDSYDLITEADIATFEAAIGASFPGDYRAFLLQHNGGYFPADVCIHPGENNPQFSSLSMLYGLKTDDYSDLQMNNRRLDNLPTGFVAIGGDDFGNKICLVTLQQDFGSVWKWDHEMQPPKDLRRLADNFGQYFSLIEYDHYREEDWLETIPGFMAAERGDAAPLLALLSDGLDIEFQNDRGETLLICAARSRQSQVVQMLLSAGAEVEACDNAGRTALHTAAAAHSVDSVKLLLAAGANIDAEDCEGDTPLLVGINIGYRVPLYLIRHGANVNHRNHAGESPLQICEVYPDYLRTPLFEAGAIQ